MLNQCINRIAIRMAVLLFFIMAVVGWACGLEPASCASRAIAGAAAIYVVIRIAGQMVVRILIGSLVDEQVRLRRAKKPQG
ncbi:MAG: hypothetical protein LLF76_10830 [Planctomycetaceae bacterium]|nr:hypothetical protein [Planctomycetaceae bacterium]